MKMGMSSEIEQQLGYINIMVLGFGFSLTLFLGLVAYSINKLLMGVNAKIVYLYACYFNNNQFMV